MRPRTSQVFGGSPDAYKTRLENIATATVEDLKTVANQWLSDGVYVLEIHPFPEYRTDLQAVDRSKMPEPGPPPDLNLPPFRRTTLANGLEVILIERHLIPVVNFRLLVDAGYASDQFAIPGTGKLAMDMLDEGTEALSSLEISEHLDRLGAQLSSGSNLDMSVVSLSALKANLDESLQIFADVILHLSFPDTEFERLRAELLAAIQREKAQPFQMALRVFPALLYGKEHAYGSPLTGSGTAASVSSISIDHLKAFHRTWFKPGNTTLVVVGDTTLSEIITKLKALFTDWERGNVPQKNIGTVHHREKTAVYVIDKPGSLQSVILAGHIAPPKANRHEIANETMNAALGGMFISRLNMNLREDKHGSYGVVSILVGARGRRPFMVLAPVQSDKTKEAMAELDRELRDITGARPLSAEELETAQSNLTLKLPGSRETMNALASSVADIVRCGLPDDYYQTYPTKVRGLTTADVADAAKSIVHPDNLVWVVVGDRAKVEEGIRELGFGELHYIDADGNAAN